MNVYKNNDYKVTIKRPICLDKGQIYDIYLALTVTTDKRRNVTTPVSTNHLALPINGQLNKANKASMTRIQ